MKRKPVFMVFLMLTVMLISMTSCEKRNSLFEFNEGVLTIQDQEGVNAWVVYCMQEKNKMQAQARQIKDTMKELVIKGNVQVIPNGAFSDCEQLERVIMTDSIEIIEARAFENDKCLKDIHWPKSLLAIGSYAFEQTAVEKIVFPEGLIAIDIFAFRNLTCLTEVILPDSLKAMNYSFSDCPKLVQVHIGSGISYLGDYEFSECDSLRSLNVPSNIIEFWEMPLKNSGIERLTVEGKIERIVKFEITEEHYPFLRQIVFLDAPPTIPREELPSFLIDHPNVTVYILNDKLDLFTPEYMTGWGDVKIVGISSLDDVPLLFNTTCRGDRVEGTVLLTHFERVEGTVLLTHFEERMCRGDGSVDTF